MKLSSIQLATFFASCVTADFHAARPLDRGNDIHQDELEYFNHFKAISDELKQCPSHIGFGGHFVFEIFNNDSQSTCPSELVNPGARLITGGADLCRDFMGLNQNICNNMPIRKWFWSVGIALLVYYLPRLMTVWLNKCAAVIQAWRNLVRAWKMDLRAPSAWLQ